MMPMRGEWWWLLLTGAVCAVVWLGRRIPLPPHRRSWILAARAGAVACLCAALWGGYSRTITRLQPQRVVYLVDRSDSMDPRQQAWAASRIASLEARRPSTVARTVVAFGATAAVVAPLGTDRLDDADQVRARLAAAPVDAGRTQLEGALFEALSVLPGRGGRVILLSDGRETSGSVQRVLPYLRRLGLAVYPEAAPLGASSVGNWDSFVVPPVVDRGSTIPVTLTVWHAGQTPAAGMLTISLAGVPVKSHPATVRPGWQVLEASVPAAEAGSVQVDVSLDVPGAGIQDTRRAYTQVQGPPQVLVVDDEPASMPWVAQALARRGFEFVSIRPDELLRHAAGLQPYEAVLLAGVSKSAITEPAAAALRGYVQGGGGLVMVGLGGDLAAEVSAAAPMDDLLPVTFEAKGLQEAKRRVCVVLLIDRSNSMYGAAMTAVKQSAITLVDQLQPEDLIGVFTFDERPYVVVEVQPVAQARQIIREKLAHLRSGGGTEAYQAFEVAKSRLELVDAQAKHVVLLSDGNMRFRRNRYQALMDAYRAQGLTISTIGVGETINTELLQWIAGATGGTYYALRSLDELPKLVAQDARDRLGTLPYTEGLYKPVRSPTAEWFEEVREWPSLKGYLTTTAKPGAQVELMVQAGEVPDPLLARWTLGLGRVAVFASDAGTRWSPRWVEWPGFEAFWAQVARWAMRPRIEEELFVWVDRARGAPQLVVEGMLQDPRGTLQEAAGGTAQPLSLVQTGPWRWTASLEGLPAGWYQLLLESQAGGSAAFASRWVQVGSPVSSVEQPGQAPQEPLLRELAAATGGLYGAGDAAFLPPSVPVTTREPLLGLWLIAALTLLLIDIALRGSTML